MSLVKLLKAVNKKIKSEFENIPIIASSDVDEKIERPCFLVDLENITDTDFVDTGLDKTRTISIVYFPSSDRNNKIENLNMIDSLNKLFIEDSILSIEDDFNLDIDSEVSSEIIEKVLHFSFEVSYTELYERQDDKENMDTLSIQGVDL